jgi:hypothetical protein
MNITGVRWELKAVLTVLSYSNFVFILRENLVNIEINYSDLNYKITQQQKAVSVPELLGKCYLAVPQFSFIFFQAFLFFFLSCLRFSLSMEEKESMIFIICQLFRLNTSTP